MQEISIKDFLNGNEKYSYPAIEVLSKPGTVFHYSGGGFLVLQHLIESFEKNDSIQNIMEPFLRKLGIANGTLTFEVKPENENQIATWNWTIAQYAMIIPNRMLGL